ncbi:unannotated protein [freshwater metagenome]|uniref:Unannotated protein n=1 Tax=freshwater metagenome TaxID=449393 RepID=A0A6J6F6Y6_9ZZZZ
MCRWHRGMREEGSEMRDRGWARRCLRSLQPHETSYDPLPPSVRACPARGNQTPRHHWRQHGASTEANEPDLGLGHARQEGHRDLQRSDKDRRGRCAGQVDRKTRSRACQRETRDDGHQGHQQGGAQKHPRRRGVDLLRPVKHAVECFAEL